MKLPDDAAEDAAMLLRLHTYWRSSAAYRVRIALAIKNVRFESVPWHLPDGEHLRAAYGGLNPQHLVPALEVGDTVIPQSLAIIEYLEEIAPHPALLPTGATDRALVRSMALAIACDIHPLNNLRVLDYLRGPLAQEEDRVQRWVRHWITTGFAALEAQANRHGDGRHMFGTEVSMADICLVPQMLNARRASCDLQPFPRLCAIASHLESLPAFEHAAPGNQPEAPAAH
jgi:maleylacetoacetate isomerase